MFQTNVLEKIKIYILYSVTFTRKSYPLRDNVEKYNRSRQVTDDNMGHAFCMLVIKAIETHTHTHTHTRNI